MCIPKSYHDILVFRNGITMFTCAGRAHVQQWHTCAVSLSYNKQKRKEQERNVGEAYPPERRSSILSFHQRQVYVPVHAHMCSSSTCARFNSKLVRLEGGITMNLAMNSSGFNSKLVRLEVVLAVLLIRFNSKLVRLEVLMKL